MGLRQPTFSFGELAESMHGRTDLDAYDGGLRRCRNFLVTPQGALLNRSGTKHVATLADVETLLVPFSIADDDGAVLVLTHENVAVYAGGVWQADVFAPGLGEELFPRLKTIQVGDIITFLHADLPPVELIRNDSTNASWTWHPLDFGLPLAFNGGIGPSMDSVSLPSADADHPAREWTWKVAPVVQDTTDGSVYEVLPETVESKVDLAAGGPSYPSAGPVPSKLAVGPTRAVTIGWPLTNGLVSQPGGWSNLRIVAQRIYRGRGRLFGFVGETAAREGVPESRQFVDVGDEPDFTMQPRQGRNPFAVYSATDPLAPDSEGSLVRVANPVCADYFNQRMLFGGTPDKPRTVWGSRIGDFLDFDKKEGPLKFWTDDDPFEFEIASSRRDDLRFIRALHRVFIGTSGGVYTVDDLGPKTAPAFTKHTNDGATWLDPVVLGDSLLYVREKGIGVNEIDFSQDRGKYQVNDLTNFARHLFESNEIVDWAFARDPHRLLYAVRDDGKLLTLTYDKTFGSLAWTWNDTGAARGDTFKNVCTVPEGDEDAVYVVTRRKYQEASGQEAATYRRFLERFSTRKTVSTWAGRANEAVFLDLHTTRSGAPARQVFGLNHLHGQEVWAVADGNVCGPFEVESLDWSITLPFAASEVQVGIRYTPELETLDYAPPKTELRAKEKIVTKAFFDVVCSRGLWTGETLDGKLYEWKQRAAAQAGAVPVFTGLVEAQIASSWNRGGRAVLRQVDPLPLTVTGIEREVAIGG